MPFMPSFDRNICKQDEKPDEERNTIVLVQFNDEPGTVMVFRVISKLNIISLRGLAAAKVSRCIQKIEDIDNIEALELPKDVVPDIRRAFSEDLKVTTYSRYLYEKTCCVLWAVVLSYPNNAIVRLTGRSQRS